MARLFTRGPLRDYYFVAYGYEASCDHTMYFGVTIEVAHDEADEMRRANRMGWSIAMAYATNAMDWKLESLALIQDEDAIQDILDAGEEFEMILIRL